jgi:hypothetical protein
LAFLKLPGSRFEVRAVYSRAAIRARAAMNRHPHILNAASNLLGICFVVIGGSKISNLNARSYSHETAWVAALLLFVSVLLSYLAIRNEDARKWQIAVADGAFIAGTVTLMLSLVVAVIQL